jgi:hypothetical protein
VAAVSTVIIVGPIRIIVVELFLFGRNGFAGGALTCGRCNLVAQIRCVSILGGTDTSSSYVAAGQHLVARTPLSSLTFYFHSSRVLFCQSLSPVGRVGRQPHEMRPGRRREKALACPYFSLHLHMNLLRVTCRLTCLARSSHCPQPPNVSPMDTGEQSGHQNDENTWR